MASFVPTTQLLDDFNVLLATCRQNIEESKDMTPEARLELTRFLEACEKRARESEAQLRPVGMLIVCL
jgi:hypothetical protein